MLRLAVVLSSTSVRRGLKFSFFQYFKPRQFRQSSELARSSHSNT